MPRSVRKAIARARSYRDGEGIEAAFEFVNTGSGAYREFTFDATRYPEQREIQRTVNGLLSEIRSCVEDPRIDWRSRLAAVTPSAPPNPELPVEPPDVDPTLPEEGLVAAWAARREAFLSAHQSHLQAMTRHLSALAALKIWETVFEAYLLHPQVRGWQIIQRCSSCSAWFLQCDARKTLCSVRCERDADAARKKSPHILNA